MKNFSVCYDKFCMGRFTLICDDAGKVVPSESPGAFEMYLLGMWNDGMVVTMKEYDEKTEQNRFILLVPDGSEQRMTYAGEKGFVVEASRNRGEGRFAYLLEFLNGLVYQGYRGYEEYDEEEELICGVVHVGDQSLTYCGVNFSEVWADFVKVIEEKLKVQ